MKDLTNSLVTGLAASGSPYVDIGSNAFGIGLPCIRIKSSTKTIEQKRVKLGCRQT
jgi:hypothetical protein